MGVQPESRTVTAGRLPVVVTWNERLIAVCIYRHCFQRDVMVAWSQSLSFSATSVLLPVQTRLLSPRTLGQSRRHLTFSLTHSRFILRHQLLAQLGNCETLPSLTRRR